jgi:hypothetical protein
MPHAPRFHPLDASIAMAFVAIALTLSVFIRPAASANTGGSLVEICHSIAKM